MPKANQSLKTYETGYKLLIAANVAVRSIMEHAREIQASVARSRSKQPTPEQEELFKSYERQLLELNDKRIELSKSLDEQAATLDVPKTTNSWTLLEWVYPGAYRSQGYGADTYFKGALQRLVDKAEYHGIQADIRDDRVFVTTTNIGADILRRKRGLPLAEEVRRMWRRGQNPRVYMPFLPHGYEDKVGIDYHGNIKDQELYDKAVAQ